MLYLNTKTDRPNTAEQTVSILKYNLDKGGMFLDYDRMKERQNYGKMKQYKCGMELRKFLGERGSRCIKPSDYAKAIIATGKTEGLLLTPSGSFSMSEDSIKQFLAYGRYDDNVNTMYKLYQVMSYYSKQCDSYDKIFERFPICKEESYDGHRMLRVIPDMAIQNTTRIGYTNPAVQNFPKEQKDIWTVPKGYVYLAADSSQIEPKFTYGWFINDEQINYLIKINKDAYYAIVQYCTMPIEWIKEKRMDIEPLVITDEMKGLRAKFKTYGNAVMYGSTSNKDGDPLKAEFIKRIGHHPARIRWQEEVTEKVAKGERYFYSLFGTPIDIYNSEAYYKAKTPNEKQTALIHCGINNPIQCTAADLQKFSLNATNELFVTRSPKSFIMATIHDENKVAIWEDDYDKVKEVAGYTSYCVDDKIYVYNEPNEGRIYNDDVPTLGNKSVCIA